eukprot:3443041-Alexandrium_andersonii.AAC.1
MPAHPEPDMRCRIARPTAPAPLPMATPQARDRSDRSDRKAIDCPLPMATPQRAIAAIGAIGSNWLPPPPHEPRL